MGIIKYYNFEISEVFIFDEFLINQIKEGAVIQPVDNDLLNDCVQFHFSGRNLVYISNRINSYTVNPLIYPEMSKIPNIIGIAIIPENDLMRKSATYEKNFYAKPYEIFDQLSDAINWAHTIISNMGNPAQKQIRLPKGRKIRNKNNS